MIKTLARVVGGFGLACLAAGLTTVLFITTPAELMSGAPDAFAERAWQTFVWGLLAATHSAIFAAIFAFIAIGVAEWLRWRGLGYYVLVGAGIALLGFYAQYASEAAGQPTIFNSYAAAAFITAGVVAGLVYWLTAGRYAGDGNRHGDATPKANERPRIVVETRPETERPKLPGKVTKPTGESGATRKNIAGPAPADTTAAD